MDIHVSASHDATNAQKEGPIPVENDDVQKVDRRISRDAEAGYFSRREDAVVQGEVRRLTHTIAPFGVLHHDQLERLSGARNWRRGAFELALGVAVRSGLLDRLPSGFYRDSTHGLGAD